MTSRRSQALNRPRSCISRASRSTYRLLAEGLHHTVSSPALWIDAGCTCSPRSLVASTRPSGPATTLDEEYDFRATAYSAARPARPVHPCAPPVEWYGLATMERAEHLLRLMEQSQRIQVFHQTIAREPLVKRTSTSTKDGGATHMAPRIRLKTLYFSVGVNRWAFSERLSPSPSTETANRSPIN